MRSLSILFILALFVVSCGETTSSSDTSESNETETEATDKGGKKYKLTPFSASTAYPDATLSNMKYDGGNFSFTVTSDSYELGVQTPDAEQKMCANSAKGQHIHLIVDDMPYAAKYVADFEHEVENGSHHILAFLSRSYHESIKTETAFLAQQVDVENGGITAANEIEGPMLFYSRPKGTYVGKANTDKVMLDFYLVNAQLGGEYLVKVNINGEEEHTLSNWQPYYIEGLPMGENTIELTLTDIEGSKVEIPLNPVKRTFTLEADPVESN